MHTTDDIFDFYLHKYRLFGSLSPRMILTTFQFRFVIISKANETHFAKQGRKIEFWRHLHFSTTESIRRRKVKDNWNRNSNDKNNPKFYEIFMNFFLSFGSENFVTSEYEIFQFYCEHSQNRKKKFFFALCKIPNK